MAENFRDPEFPPPANPYAPPEVDLTPDFRLPGKPLAKGTEPFSASLVLGRSWQLFKQRPLLIIGVVIGSLFINWLVNTGMQVLLGLAASTLRENPIFFVVLVIYFVANLMFNFWLNCGQSLTLLKVARNEYAEFADLFRGGPYVVRFTIASLLVSLLYLGVVAACMLPLGLVALAGESSQSTTFGVTMLGCLAAASIGALILTARVYQYPYLIIDCELGAVESVQKSLEITRGKTIEIVGLLIVTSLIAFLGFLACGVGAIVSFPLSMFIVACTYVALTTGLPKDFFLETDSPLGETI